MKISSISFGKKIPEVKCSIIDKTENKRINAVLYRYDCSDKSDYEEMESLTGRFTYNYILAIFMKKVFEGKTTRKRQFYSLETPENGILGIAQTHISRDENNNNTLVVDYIEKNRAANFKYIGQSILASLCKKTKNADFIEISNPVDTAIDFYTKKCGFIKTDDKKELKIKKENFKDLVELTEKKTEGKIEDIIDT